MFRTMVLALSFVGACSAAQAIEINIVNRSAATIHQIYVASDEATEWGDDRLGSDALGPEGSAPINLESGSYEVRLIDEKELECKIADSFITSNPTWDITDESVSHCEGFGVAQAGPGTDATVMAPRGPKLRGAHYSSVKIAHASNRQPE